MKLDVETLLELGEVSHQVKAPTETVRLGGPHNDLLSDRIFGPLYR